MRKEYDLRALKVKRRGPLPELKSAASRKPDHAKSGTSRAKVASGYSKRTER